MSEHQRTLYLIRHAKALDRNEWGDTDNDRPLSAAGEKQAILLAEELGGTPIEAIYSSPARRCVDTVAPLASVLGITVDVDPACAEGMSISIPDQYKQCAICAHGDNIPDLLRRLGVDYESCRKASTWRVTLDANEVVVDAVYLPPPRVD